MNLGREPVAGSNNSLAELEPDNSKEQAFTRMACSFYHVICWGKNLIRVMREWITRLCHMADGTFVQRSSIALKIDEFHRILGLAALGDGMCAVMAGFAVGRCSSPSARQRMVARLIATSRHPSSLHHPDNRRVTTKDGFGRSLLIRRQRLHSS